MELLRLGPKKLSSSPPRKIILWPELPELLDELVVPTLPEEEDPLLPVAAELLAAGG